ncbi:MAG: hypothetical protein O2955_08715 [Planctomycetota bacterium]|nr:hypothetical protein [Planctomycetota bacterium]MDA1212587.1 hypothetical protein [Planctomycetota bacterium]
MKFIRISERTIQRTIMDVGRLHYLVMGLLIVWFTGPASLTRAQETNQLAQQTNRDSPQSTGEKVNDGASGLNLPGITGIPGLGLREIFVSADRPEQWPPGDWQPMSRREFFSMWTRLRPKAPEPQSAWIEHATYSAVFSKKALQSGQGQWLIHRRQRETQVIHVEPLGLAISDFRSNGTNSAWGTTSSGRNILLIDDDKTTAEFSWSLDGRVRRHSVEFELRIPSATSSTLQILLPEGVKLDSSAGEVTGPTTVDQIGWNQWQVNLGQESYCLLNVHEILPAPVVQPPWMIRQQTSYLIRPEGAEIVTDLNVETTSEPVDRIQVPIPSEVDVYSVSYGNDSSISWTLSSEFESNENLLTIELPDPVSGPLRQIRINSFTEAVVDQEWRLPMIRAPGLFLQGNIQLTIEPPLQLNEIHTQGCRLQKTSSSTASGTTYELLQNNPSTEIAIQIAFPAVQLTSQILHHLAYESSTWTWNAEMSLRSRSGSTYQIRSLLPIHWDIAEVQLLGPQTGVGQILKWTVEPATSESQWLIVDVAKAIDAEHPLSFKLRAKQTQGTADDLLRFPYLEPQQCQVSETVYAIQSPGNESPHEQLADGVQQTSAEALNKTWSTSLLYQSLIASTEPSLWFVTSQISSEGTFLEYPHFRQGLTGTATVEYDFLSDRLIERFFIFVEPVSQPIDRILVYVTGTGPEFTWEQLSDRVIPVSAQRLPEERHQNWNLPANGELWEIRLPIATQEPVRLRAQRVRYHAGQTLGQLVFLPQSRSFRGTIELLDNTRGVKLESITSARPLQSQDVVSTDQNSDSSTKVLQWEYESSSETFEMRIKPELASGQVTPATVVNLQSQIFADGTGENHHRVRFDLLGDVQSVEFVYELPPHVNWIATRVNGQEVHPQYRGVQHVVSLSLATVETLAARSPSSQIEIEYQEPAKAVWLWNREQIPLPRVDIPVVQFHWEIQLPDGYRIDSASPGLNTMAAESFDWNARFFGPISRSETQHRFDPFRVSGWRKMYQRLRNIVNRTTESQGDSWQHLNLQGQSIPSALTIVVWNENRLTWIGWCALSCTLLMGGAVRIYSPRSITAFSGITWWSLLLAAVWFAPEPFTLPLGGITFGSLMIALAPSNWMKKLWFFQSDVPQSVSADDSDLTQPMIDPKNSTPSHIALMVLIVLSLTARSTAQTESTVTVPSSNGRRADAVVSPQPSEYGPASTWDVLIPFSLEEGGREQGDLVYLRSDHAKQFAELSKLLQSDTVDYVITSAKYTGRWNVQENLLIEAKFLLAVFANSERPTTVVELPIGNANLARDSACIVDGKPHTILAVPNRAGFTIELETLPTSPLPPPLPEDATIDDKTDHTSKRKFGDIQFREVTLFLHPVVKSHNDGETFHLEIPPVSQSQLCLFFSQMPLEIHVNGKQRYLRNDSSNSNEFIAQLGRQHQLDVSWRLQQQKPVPIELNVLHQSLLEFAPTIVRGQSRIHHRMHNGVVQDVLWNIPDGVVINNITGENLSAFELYSTPNGGRQLLIELSEPVAEDFVLEVDWLSPVTADGSGRISIAPLSWLGRSADANMAVEFDDVQVGVTGRPGYELLSSTDEQMILREIPAADFYKIWGIEGEARRASQISSFAPESRIAFELRPLRSVRKARQDEIFRFTRQRVFWEATIEVETSQTPALVHEIVLDSSIQLEEISVKQDDAERLSHSIRYNDRLKLILKDLTSSTQFITLRGFIPAIIGEEMPLPPVYYQADEMDRASVAIRYDKSVRVELVPKNLWEPFPAEQDVAPNDADWKTLGRFIRQPESHFSDNQPTTRQSIRSSVESSRSPELSHFVAIKPKTGKTWFVRMLWHVEQFHDSNAIIRIELPPELTTAKILSGNEANLDSDDATGQKRTITFKPDAANPTGHVLIVEGEWTIKGEGSWTVPDAQLIGGDVIERWLMISPRDVMRPKEGGERQVPEEIPLWTQPGIDLYFSGNVARLYHKPRGEWILTPATPHNPQARLTVPWIRSECRFDASMGWQGRSEICVESAPGRVLKIDIPTGMQLIAVLLNGTTITSTVTDQRELAIPLGTTNSSGPMNMVDLIWERPFETAQHILLNTTIELPQVKEYTPDHNFVEIVTSLRQRRLAVSGITPRNEWEYHLDMAERLSNQIAKFSDNRQESNERLRRNLIQELRFLNVLEHEAPRLLTQQPELFARWQSLQETYQEELSAETKVDTTAESLWISTAFRRQQVSDVDIVQGEWNGAETKSNIALWWINTRWYFGLLASFSFGLTWFVLRKLTSWINLTRSGVPVPVFAISLTLIWWLFLKASIIGFGLLVYVVYRSWKQWRTTPRTPIARAAT